MNRPVNSHVSPPHSIEAECAVLGALLLDAERAWPIVSSRVSAGDFSRYEHQLIFGSIARLTHASSAVDVVTVYGELRDQGFSDVVGGAKYLDELAQHVPSVAHLETYAMSVRTSAIRRKLFGIAETFSGDQDGLRNALRDLDESLAANRSRSAVSMRELDMQIVAALGDAFEPDDELVEGLLVRGGLSVLYGDSNSGKTYLVLDLAAAIANGQYGWMGHAVDGGLVVYLAAEAPRSVRRRMQAYMRERGRDGMQRFVVVNSPVNFYDNATDAQAVVQAIREAEAKTGEKCVLVVGDTLARLSAGANENAGQDMGVVLAHIDAIRAATGAHFMLIHHTGKDQTKGARGWSGLRAAVDTEIEVSETNSGERIAEVTKQRDLPSKGMRIGFRLLPADLGTTKWGRRATACTVEAIEAPAKAPHRRRPSEVEGAVAEYLIARKTGAKCAELVKHFDGRFHRASVYKAINNLVEVGAVHQAAGMVCIAAKVTQ